MRACTQRLPNRLPSSAKIVKADRKRALVPSFPRRNLFKTMSKIIKSGTPTPLHKKRGRNPIGFRPRIYTIPRLFARLDVQFHRTNHILGLENRVKLLLRENTVFEHQIINAATRSESLLGDLGRSLVTCLLYTSPSPRDKRQSRMPSSA